ncbi:MAG: response regulator [Candidatus Pacebacteria bacterium]|nr:response regulator [Candidatus Paceibacterota bacterium]
MDTAPQKLAAMIVDDDSFLVTLYKKKAEEEGLDLKTALSGEEAISILKEGFQPKVIALDMSMAGMTGMDILREIKTKNLAPDAKVIFLSNTADDATVAEAKELGVYKFVVKASLLPSQVIDELLKIAGE